MAETMLDPLEQQKAAALARFLDERVSEFMGGGDRDARIVAVACAGLAGSCIFGIQDTALKHEIAEIYISTFRHFADVPDRPDGKVS